MSAVESDDVETQQEMVDEAAKRAGYDSPKVYHGTDSKSFEIFSKRKRGSATDNGMLGKAFYFGSERTAERYGDTVIPAYLSIKNPLEIDSFHNKEDLAKYLNIDSSILTVGGTGIKSLQSYTGVFSDSVKEKGHDGIVTKFETAVFEPTQIKSADPVTYDSDGKVIPLSQRFNEQDDRLSFSIAPDVETRIHKAASMAAIEIPALKGNPNTKELKEIIKKEIGKGVKHTESGHMVTFTGGSLGKVIGGLHAEKKAVLANISEVIKKSVWLRGEDPRPTKKSQREREIEYHSLAVPVIYEKDQYVAFLQVRKMQSRRDLYNVLALEIRSLNLDTDNSHNHRGAGVLTEARENIIKKRLAVNDELALPDSTFSIARKGDPVVERIHALMRNDAPAHRDDIKEALKGKRSQGGPIASTESLRHLTFQEASIKLSAEKPKHYRGLIN